MHLRQRSHGAAEQAQWRQSALRHRRDTLAYSWNQKYLHLYDLSDCVYTKLAFEVDFEFYLLVAITFSLLFLFLNLNFTSCIYTKSK